MTCPNVKWNVTQEELLRRPIVVVNLNDLYSVVEEDGVVGAGIPLAFAAPMRLLRIKHANSIAENRPSFLENLPSLNPEMECDNEVFPTPAEFNSIMGDIILANYYAKMPWGVQLCHKMPDFRNPRTVAIYARVVAHWLLNECMNYQECDNAIGHYPASVIFEVIVQLMKSVQPRMVLLSMTTLKAMSSIYLLRSPNPISLTDHFFPRNILELLHPRSRNGQLRTSDDLVMAAIRCTNVAILRDIAMNPSEVMRNLAGYLPFHAISLVMEHFNSMFPYPTRRVDHMWLRNLLMRDSELAQVVFRLSLRFGMTYFEYPTQFTDNVFMEVQNEFARSTRRETVPSRIKERLEKSLCSKLGWIGTHCFMNMIVSCYKAAYEPGRGWQHAVIHRNGTLCGPLCFCQIKDPIYL